MKKMKKWKNGKMMKKRKKNEESWIYTKNLRRFPGFAVVVVTLFVKILEDFHDFVFGMCLFPHENQQPIWGGHRFSEERRQFSLDVKQKHTPLKPLFLFFLLFFLPFFLSFSCFLFSFFLIFFTSSFFRFFSIFFIFSFFSEEKSSFHSFFL